MPSIASGPPWASRAWVNGFANRISRASRGRLTPTSRKPYSTTAPSTSSVRTNAGNHSSIEKNLAPPPRQLPRDGLPEPPGGQPQQHDREPGKHQEVRRHRGDPAAIADE